MGGRGATSSHGKTKTKEKPRQKGHLTGDQIPKTPEETAKYIGSTVQEAKDMYNAVKTFTSNSGYGLMRDAQMGKNQSATGKKLAEQAEKYIDHAPKWGGGVTYRGVPMSKKQLAAIKAGKPVDPGLSALASWSTQEGTARGFASKGGSGSAHVVFVSQTKNKGTSIKHISHYAHENEVLVSKNAKYTVTSISTKPGSPYTYVYVKEN